jgi:hypothetical protein
VLVGWATYSIYSAWAADVKMLGLRRSKLSQLL